MKDGKLGFGIAGCGVIGPWHLKGVQECPLAEAVAVADIVEDKAKKMAEENSIPRYYTNVKEMVKDEEVDIVCVCTPSGAHAEVGIAAAEAGKHVLCEKPIEITLEATDNLIQACRENGVKLGGIFQSRTYPASKKVRDAIQSGILGKMVLGDVYMKFYRARAYYASAGWRGTWALDGGGALMNQGIHGIDLLLWIMGDEVESVYAKTDHFVRDIEVEDTAAAIVTYKSGTIGVIQGTTSCNPGEPVRHMFHGDKGTITLENGKILRWAVTNEEDGRAKDEELSGDESEVKGAVADPKAISAGGHIVLVADIVDAVKNDRDPMITGESSRKSVALINAIYQSARTGSEVKLSDPG